MIIIGHKVLCQFEISISDSASNFWITLNNLILIKKKKSFEFM